MKMLFVCLGNICRSPAAEAVARYHQPQWEVDSAGLGAWHIGEPPDPRSQAEGRKRGYDLSQQRARQIQRQDFTEFDYIFAMDASVLSRLQALAPESSTAKLALFLETGDVPDPYYDDSFAQSYDLIEARLQTLRAD